MTAPELPLFAHWERTLSDLLDRTQRFPKSVRFTFSSRIDNLALDVVEQIAEARFAPAGRKGEHLRAIDSALLRLRVLLRICHDRRYLDHGGYEHVMRSIDEAGRMLGGWRRQQEGR